MLAIGVIFGVVFVLASNVYYQEQAERKIKEATRVHTAEIERLLALLVEARAGRRAKRGA